MKSKARYKELDSLRGVACLSVFFFHVTMGKQEYNQILRLGVTGVDLFFMISGFVIFLNIQNISSGREFLINRFSRLYPTYWACVTFTFIMMVVYSIYKNDFYPSLTSFIGNLSMFQYYLGVPDLDGSYWTMIVEMLFYILILFLFKSKIIKKLNLFFIVACLIVPIVIYYSYDKKLLYNIVKYCPLIQFISLFFSGIIFYKIKVGSIKTIYGYMIIIFCLLCQIAIFPYIGRSRVFISWSEYGFMITFYFFLFTLLVNSKLSFIVNKLTLFLGKISFAFYLVHQYISLSLIIPLFYGKLGINFLLVVCFINLPLVVLIAYFITYNVEVPYSKIIRYKLTKRLILLK